MALNGRRSLTLTEWQSLPLVAEWQAFTLFCHNFLRFAIKQSLIALSLRAKPVCHSMPSLLRFDKGQSPHQQKNSRLSSFVSRLFIIFAKRKKPMANGYRCD